MPFLRKLDLILSTRSSSGLILYLKLIREGWTNYLSGNVKPIPNLRLTKDGLPIALGDLIPIIRGLSTPDEIKSHLPLINTILYCTRYLKTGKLPNTNDITQPAKQVPSDISKYGKDF
jgi:hypothetical protein